MLVTSKRCYKKRKENTYTDPIKSTNWISSSISCSLHQKPNEVITFHLIFSIVHSFPSKILWFLSFQIIHQIHAGIVFHHLFWLLLPLLLIQQLSRSAVCSGMIQLTLAIFVNKAQTCVVTLQWRNKWLFDSKDSLHRKHLEAMLIPLSYIASWVKRALLATNEVKHFTLVGATLFQIAFEGPAFLLALPKRPQL